MFDVTRLDRVRPWQIKLAEIVKALVEELERLQVIDLNSCGVAAYSAAMIHRMKTESLLKADVPRAPKERLSIFVPPPVDLPLTSEFMITTINELIQALQAIFLRKSKADISEERGIVEGIDVKLDDFLVKLEERLEEFMVMLRESFDGRDFIRFSELFRGLNRLEAVRRFILLLFAATKGFVDLVEDDEHRVIGVKWNGGHKRAEGQG